jgi:hypothetical protein
MAPVGTDGFMANFGTSATEKFHNVRTTPDNGYVVTGQVGREIVAAKLNMYGHLEWRKTFKDVLGSNINGIDVDQDGSIFISGFVDKVPGVNPKSLWVTKLAPWGGTVWEKIVTDCVSSSRGLYLTADNNGGCAVSSQFRSGSDDNEWTVFQLSAAGTLSWANRYGSDDFDMWCRISPAVNPASGVHDGYLIYEYNTAMGSSVDSNDIVLIRIDAGGNVLWSRNYAGYADATHQNPENDFALKAIQTRDGGFAVLGKSYNFSDPSWDRKRRVGYLFKVDSSGTLLWSRYFHHNDGSGNDLTNGSMCETPGGDLVIAGNDYQYNAWILKFDSAGILLKERVFENSGKDYLLGIAATADNGAVAVGRSNSFGDGGYDAWMIKFDKDLEVLDQCPGIDPYSVVGDAEFVEGIATPHGIAMQGWASRDWTSETCDPEFYVYHICARDNDADNDGVFDYLDNAPWVSNPDQTDTDNDGIGNIVDCDINNNGVVEVMDFMIFRSLWGSTDEVVDFNADGAVNQHDYSILRNLWGTSYPWM